MDKLKLARPNLGWVINFKYACVQHELLP